MKKIFVFLLLFILNSLFLALHAQLVDKENFVKDIKDSTGQLVERDYYHKKDSSLNSKEFYVNGKLHHTDLYSGKWMMYRKKFDDKKRETREVAYSMTGAINDSCLFAYNADGSWTNTTYDNKGIKLSVETHNTKGEETKTEYYNPDGKISHWQKIEHIGNSPVYNATRYTSYNASNVKQSMEVFHPAGQRRELTIFDTLGKIQSYTVQEDASTYMSYTSEMDNYQEDGSYSKSKYVFFKHANYTTSQPGDTRYYNAKGKLQYRCVSTYDSLGHKQEDNWFDGKEQPKFKDFYTNDAFGQPKDILRKYPDGRSEYVMQDGKRISDSDKKGEKDLK